MKQYIIACTLVQALSGPSEKLNTKNHLEICAQEPLSLLIEKIAPNPDLVHAEVFSYIRKKINDSHYCIKKEATEKVQLLFSKSSKKILRTFDFGESLMSAMFYITMHLRESQNTQNAQAHPNLWYDYYMEECKIASDEMRNLDDNFTRMLTKKKNKDKIQLLRTIQYYHAVILEYYEFISSFLNKYYSSPRKQTTPPKVQITEIKNNLQTS